MVVMPEASVLSLKSGLKNGKKCATSGAVAKERPTAAVTEKVIKEVSQSECLG